MQLLKFAVVAMGVLIVVGTLTLAVLLTRRIGPPAPLAGAVLLTEPPGSRIAAASLAQDRLLLQLQGGGPDRVVVVDSATGRVLARVGLTPASVTGSALGAAP